MGDSIDELKEVVAQSLEASGVLAKLRAQIRKHVFDVIDEVAFNFVFMSCLLFEVRKLCPARSRNQNAR